MTENNFITPGIKDEDFIRGEVPMTKEEVRDVSICKLQLKDDSVLYDVGSGTGSVAVEAARISKGIKVYAFETKAEAVSLVRQNAQKFNLANIKVIEGLAPLSFTDVPVPTHAFIGGSKGHLKEILEALYRRNDRMRIVINAVSLDTISVLNEWFEKNKVENLDVTELSVTKAIKVQSYSMLRSNNPVFIYAFDFVPEGEADED